GGHPDNHRERASDGQDRAPRDPRPRQRVLRLRLLVLPEPAACLVWADSGDLHARDSGGHVWGGRHHDGTGRNGHYSRPAVLACSPTLRPTPASRPPASPSRPRAAGAGTRVMEPVAHWVVEPFAHAFMQRALIEVILMGAVTGAIGTYVVLRGLSFVGD